ncbi:hypothetical protein BGP_0445 [Beggiatoa sp. PS]|nr:hypothetical protein BGP_0445 [Beggiatoa sp. PS]
MKLSQFELNVIEALIQDDLEEKIIRSQLEDAKVTKRDYTGVGLYTEILVQKKCSRLSKSNRYIEEIPKAHLEHPELSYGAGAILWFNEGYVSTLECYTYEGNWPKDESLFNIYINSIIQIKD